METISVVTGGSLGHCWVMTPRAGEAWPPCEPRGEEEGNITKLYHVYHLVNYILVALPEML